jgi:hypothetical protein
MAPDFYAPLDLFASGTSARDPTRQDFVLPFWKTFLA